MSTTTYDAARDDVFELLNDTWNANSAAIVGYVPEIRWPGVIYTEHPPNDKIWARPSFKTVIDGQQTLSNAGGVSRYAAKCLFYLQIFCPLNDPDNALNKGILLAKNIQTAFRHGLNDVWFQDQQVRELDPTPESYPINVVVVCNFETLE